MENQNYEKKDFSLINCIATALLAYFFTIPFHEFIHLVTHLIYGDKITLFTAGSVGYEPIFDYFHHAPFHRIMSGGSASILNAIIGIILFIVLLNVPTIPSMLRLFLTQLMGGQLLEGIGYFLIGGLFATGDYNVVFSYFPDNPGFVTGMRIFLSAIGIVGAFVMLYILTYMTYTFVEDPSDKSERKYVSTRLNLCFLLTVIVVILSLAIVAGGNIMTIFYNSMWLLYLVAFFYGWHGIMAKPPKESKFRCSIPTEAHPVVWGIAVVLILIDIFVFGPGIHLN